MVVIISNTDNDKITLTKEELDKIINEARAEGFNDGFRAGISTNLPQYPIQPNLQDFYYKNTCNTTKN